MPENKGLLNLNQYLHASSNLNEIYPGGYSNKTYLSTLQVHIKAVELNSQIVCSLRIPFKSKIVYPPHILVSTELLDIDFFRLYFWIFPQRHVYSVAFIDSSEPSTSLRASQSEVQRNQQLDRTSSARTEIALVEWLRLRASVSVCHRSAATALAIVWECVKCALKELKSWI